MDASSQSIVRGEFVYYNALFVDVGGALKRHARASPSDLKIYLDGQAPKDQVAHFYEAQLIHYGLQRSKEKNTAKVRLQQALNHGRLTVPPHVVEMEAQMKREYAAGVKRSRNAAGNVARGNEVDSGLASGKKRNQNSTDLESASSPSKKTRITMKVGDVEVSIDQSAIGAAGNGSKTKSASRSPVTASSPSKSQAIHTTTTTPTRKPPVTSQIKKTPQSQVQFPPFLANKSPRKLVQPPGTSPLAKPSVTPSPKKTTQSKLQFPPFLAGKGPSKSTQSSGTPLTSPSPQKREPKLEPKVKKEPSASQWSLTKASLKPGPKVKQESSATQWSPTKASPKIKAEIKSESDNVDSPETRFITGVYKVSSPQLEQQYPHEAGNLRFFLCVDNEARKLWGGFQLAQKSGVLCLTGDYTSTNAPLSFGWRARDSEQGKLSFGRGCFGEITFFDNGRFRATISHLFPELIELEGERRPGPLWCGKSAWQFEREWDGFVAEAYGR